MPDAPGYSAGASAVPPSDAEPGIATGTVIADRYRVDRVIGRGGMGVVVAATQLLLDRTVAIKLVRADCAHDPMAVERLLREAKAAASIKSEHVARVLDVGTLEDGAPFVVMEYLEGRDLSSLLEQDGPLPASEAVDIVLEACEALAEAHRNGIVHRDIKPANLFMARLPGGASTVKVVDFGISKLIRPDPSPALTMPATIVGSLYHMAPEQMRGEAVDARTDVWALGLLLFELLTGTMPFIDQAWPAMCARVLHGRAPLIEGPVPGVGEDLLSIIGQCVRRQPDDRFASVAELALALERFGTRRGHASLERILLLAQSTGSAAAAKVASPRWMLEPTEPFGGQPSPAASSATPSAVTVAGAKAAAGSAHAASTPLGVSATRSTPLPVSSTSAPRRAGLSRAPFAMAAATAVLVIGVAVVWLGPKAREPHERVTPLRPTPAGPAIAGATTSGAATSGATIAGAAQPSSPALDATPPGASPPGSSGAQPPEDARPRGPSVAPLSLPEGADDQARQAAPRSNAGRAASPPGSAGAAAKLITPRSGIESGAATHAAEAPSPGDMAGSASAGATGRSDAEQAPRPSTPAAKPVRARSPWELDDIEFHDDARR